MTSPSFEGEDDLTTFGDRVMPQPLPSMYGIFTYIYFKFQPNVGKYTIHGSYGQLVQTIPTTGCISVISLM